MSCANPKSAGWHDVQDKFNKIQDAMLHLRPQLAISSLEPPDSLIKELAEVAYLANSIAVWRSKGSKSTGGGHDAWKETIDALDRDGVELWNTAGILRFSPVTPAEKVSKTQAMMRLAAFRLIDAGLEVSPPIETLAHTLHVACKTGVAIANSGQEKLAMEVLTRAAQLESNLSNLESDNISHEKTKAAASVAYFSSRMEVSITASKDPDQAWFMLQQIAESEPKKLTLISRQDREQLSAKLLEIAKDMLRTGQSEAAQNNTVEINLAESALRWLKKALSLLDGHEGEASTTSRTLKRGILRSLARAYYITSATLPDSLAKAWAAIDDILNESVPLESENELLQVRWMKLAIVKKCEDDEAILQACAGVIENVPLSAECVADIIQEARGFASRFTLCSSILQTLLEKTLEDEGNNPFVDKVLMTFVFICSRESDRQKALQAVALACTAVAKSTFRFTKVSCVATLSLLWQTAERLYSTQSWKDAAEWYLLGTHEAFHIMASTSGPKCLRKAALCYIECRELQKAIDIAQRCPKEEASTSYVMFLAKVHQGKENEALQMIETMVAAPDFDRRMLFLATQLAHENKMRHLLLTILQSLLYTLQGDYTRDASFEAKSVEGITLIRCIIRLIIEMLKEPRADVTALLETLNRHYSKALNFTLDVKSKGHLSVIRKDISWLWRSGYNTAVGGCTEWEDLELGIATLFELTEQLMVLSDEDIASANGQEFDTYRCFAAFSSISGKVFATRRLTGERFVDLQQSILVQIQTLKDFIETLSGNRQQPVDTHKSESHIRDITHTILLFEIEILCQQQDWHAVQTLLKFDDESGKRGKPPMALEAIADMLWTADHCPTTVLETCVEALLHAYLESDTCSMLSFAHWMRVLCTLLLARGTEASTRKSLEYAEAAAKLVNEHGQSYTEKESYPEDEHLWLLVTCYNTGVECFTSNLIPLAKRWLETATILSKHRESGDLPSYISEVYRELLARYPNQ